MLLLISKTVGFLALVAAKEISMLLIGSSALAFTADISREPKDADLIATIDEYEDFVAKHRESLVSTYPINKGKKCIVFAIVDVCLLRPKQD